MRQKYSFDWCLMDEMHDHEADDMNDMNDMNDLHDVNDE